MSATGNRLLDHAILPTLLRLSWPNMAAMAITALVAVAETGYAGVLGTPALAGLALVFPFVMLQQMMSAGAMGGGISSAISRALGAGDRERASALALHALVIGCLAGLVFTGSMLLAGPYFYAGLGGRDAALKEAMAYANIVFLGSIGVWLTNTLASILRGTGNMAVPSSVLLVVSMTQIALGAWLGLGFGPMPRLGMAGVALATTLAFSGGAAWLLWYVMSGRARVTLSFNAGALQGAMFADILKVGAIACAAPMMSVLTILVLTALVARLGLEALAGYGIGARLEFLLVPITFAIGVASVPMVGMAIGAGRIERARRVAWTAAALAGGVTGVVGLVVTVAPDVWSTMFTTDAAVLAAARAYFKWAGPSYAFYGIGLALYFASQGSGKIIGPVLAQAARLMVIVVGGWWAVRANGSASTLFGLVGLAMVVYGAVSVIAMWLTDWSPRAAAATIAA
jgi:putative MATE family efflux protein